MANVSSFSGAMPVIPGGLVELGYVEIASSVTVTSSTAGSGTEIIAPLTVVCDGSPVLVEFFCGQISTPNTSGAQTYTTLNQDGVEKVRYWGFASSPAATYDDKPQHLSYRTTPSAGSHTFGVKAFNSAPSLSAFYKAQNTTIGVAPAFLRVSKIVSQNDGLKPFWKPPIVTQLPTLAQVGDQVVYAADATNGVYWLLQYDGLGTYPWKFIGGPPLSASGGGYVAVTSVAPTFASISGASVTAALAGDYSIRVEGQVQNQAGYATYLSCSYGATVPTTYEGPIAYSPTTTVDAGGSREARKTLAASDAVVAKGAVNAGTGYIGYTRVLLTPIRVKAA